MTEALFEDGAPHRKPLNIAGLHSHLDICICICIDIDIFVFLLVNKQICRSVFGFNSHYALWQERGIDFDVCTCFKSMMSWPSPLYSFSIGSPSVPASNRSGCHRLLKGDL